MFTTQKEIYAPNIESYNIINKTTSHHFITKQIYISQSIPEKKVRL